MLYQRNRIRVARTVGVFLAAVALLAPGLASASIGTGVGAAPLVLATPAHVGKSYTFHWLYVKDTGTATSSYLVKPERISQGSEKVVPATWIQLAPATFRLRPKEIKRVTVTVNVPFSASSGRYMTDLVATTYAPHRPGATALGAAAADKLTFSIPSSSSFPWIIVAIAGGLVLLLAAGYAVRRSGLRLSVDRGRTSA
jgi:hypothetical protein